MTCGEALQPYVPALIAFVGLIIGFAMAKLR